MRTLTALLAVLFLSSHAWAGTGVRVVFGLGDSGDIKWDGSVTARGASITSLEGWRFDAQDGIIPPNSWRASIHRIRLFGGGQQAQPPFVANGVVIWLSNESDSSQLDIRTAQGDFPVRLADIPLGTMRHELNGRVMIDRLPALSRITDSPDEQDYPAAARDAAGNVWLAYLEFRHHPDHARLRLPLREAPADFSVFTQTPGGDQVLLKRYANGAWSDPIAITSPGGDLYRPAVAVDGRGRPWVFWSANEKGNFDVWARPVENGQPGKTVRLTDQPGSDIDPAAATDAKGRVWVTWQGWRNGRAAIFAAVQNGDAFSVPIPVSNSPANEWNPAVAADSSGRVSIAWDSYRNGDYDIYLRTATGEKQWGSETPIAATLKYEAYPSLAYDPSGRLWIAYEEGGERWGKDFGAYSTAGVSVYQGRAVRLVALGRDGRLLKTETDIAAIAPGVASQRADSTDRQAAATGWTSPDPNKSKDRTPSRPSANFQAPRNSMPRVTVDPSGRVWVAFRSMHPIWWSQIGTVWTEFVASYNGRQWTGPIFLARSDNLLDNRPALIAPRAGELMVLGSSDGRREFHMLNPMGAPRRAAAMQQTVRDPYNNDLWMNTLSLPVASGEVALNPAGAASVAVDPLKKTEDASAARLRGYRLKSGAGELRIVRGEFHRHSEASTDGGWDGTLIDQWRYMLDAAAMDWVGCCDHDNGNGREYTWWITQKLTDVFYSPGKFVPMFSYERSVAYPEGHRNVVFARRGIRTLPRLPISSPDSAGHAADTQMLYRYLRKFDGVVASHTSGTNMGTDWRDNDPIAEPLVEIYQGDRQNYEMPGAPRSNSEADSIGGWRPKGFVNLALEMGYQLGFQASSDHVSTHMSYCNILAKDLSRASILEALKNRHVYGATDDILADVRSGGHVMGDAFSSAAKPVIEVKLAGKAAFARVQVIKDNKYVYSVEPKKADVSFTWRDNDPAPGKTSYYYVRGDQEDGEIVWASPMWITYTGK